MEKKIVNQVQEAQRVPSRISPRKTMTRHILIKLTKTKHKERILKAAREKQQVTYKGNPIRLTADLSAETLQARREWQDIFKVLKGKNLLPRLLYLARISFKTDGEIKSFLILFLFLFFFWDPYNSNVGAFDIVLDVSETILSCFSFF